MKKTLMAAVAVTATLLMTFEMDKMDVIWPPATWFTGTRPSDPPDLHQT